MSQKPLTPWVVVEENGKIIAGHSDCMAGLGESCSHVASLLGAVESGVCLRDSLTVTQKEAYWVIPSAVKNVPYAPLQRMNFLDRKRSQTQLISSQSSHSPSLSLRNKVPEPTDEDISSWFPWHPKTSNS